LHIGYAILLGQIFSASVGETMSKTVTRFVINYIRLSLVPSTAFPLKFCPRQRTWRSVFEKQGYNFPLTLHIDL